LGSSKLRRGGEAKKGETKEKEKPLTKGGGNGGGDPPCLGRLGILGWPDKTGGGGGVGWGGWGVSKGGGKKWRGGG